ncbi:MAG: DeoR family transcriptional regulator [Candidatus Methanoperedens sp.]
MNAIIFKPVHLKILVLLDRMELLASRRIAEVLNISRETAERKLEYLESKGLTRIHGSKLFRKGREANMWGSTEEGKSFVDAARNKGELPRIKISEMSKTLVAACSEIMKLLEKPLSFDELYTTLEASGVKISKYNKFSDALRLLEKLGLIKKVQGHKEIKVLEQIGMTTVSSVPGGVIVFMKTEGADLDSVEF